MAKENNKKLIIWVVVALIVSIIIGLLITNLVPIGNASKIMKKDFNNKFTVNTQLTDDLSRINTVITMPSTRNDELNVCYNDDIFNISYNTNQHISPTIDGIITDTEKIGTTKKLNIPNEYNSDIVENFYIKLVDNKIYFAVEDIILQDNYDCNLNGITSLYLFFDEGHQTEYGSGNLDYIYTPHQEDLKHISIHPQLNNGLPTKSDGYLYSVSSDGLGTTFVWYYGNSFPEQVDFIGQMSSQTTDGVCKLSGEMLVPLSGQDGIYVDGQNGPYDDQSDLNLGSDYGIIGMKYFFSPNDIGYSDYSTYSGYFKLRISRIPIAPKTNEEANIE
jgi:hypothetical protein